MLKNTSESTMKKSMMEMEKFIIDVKFNAARIKNPYILKCTLVYNCKNARIRIYVCINIKIIFQTDK